MLFQILLFLLGTTFTLGAVQTYADPASSPSTNATVIALRIAASVTGGLMPATAPEFQKMVTAIESGDYVGAAMIAANSNYCATYLVRRMAKEMMTPQLSSAGIPDNDATTLIVANLVGSGTQANISKLWSDDATYLINVAGTQKHAMDLTSAQLAAVNWRTDLVRVSGQTAKDNGGNSTSIAAKDVGGYMTLSDRGNDQSFAQYAFTAGTNLRGIEGLYEISMGLSLQDLIVFDGSSPQVAPRFVPEQDPNFFVGQGQPACLSCHGGGPSNLTHGYATMADKFDDRGQGLVYYSVTNTRLMKSLGSNQADRPSVATCDLSKFSTCNPDSLGADPNQAWDLTTWQQGGLLSQMGWQGATMGQGLNALGTALGQASLVYQFMVKRVIGEVCPLGSIGANQQASIAKSAQQQDSFSYIVAAVASDPSCR